MSTPEDMPNLDDAEVERCLEQIETDAWEHGEYAESRAREQLDALLHYGHVIPISHGFTARYVRENYPGWTWNQLLDVLTAAEVVKLRGGSPPCCVDGVIRVEFDSPTGWRVEWTDGRTTHGPTAPGFSSRPESRRNETPIFDLGTARTLEVDEDGAVS